MIEALTKEQEAMIPVIRDRWIKIGLDTSPFTKEEAETIIHNLQEHILETKKTPVEIYDDISLAWKRIEEIYGEKMSFVYPALTGSFSAHTFSFYDFFLETGLVKFPEELLKKYEAWKAITKLGLIYPLEEVCIVTKKPSKISTNDKGQLHCEDGKALEYPSGWGFYCLNGIKVPEYLVMTPAENLDIEFFKKEKNADVKAEFVRKFGVERMLEMGKKLDTFRNYDQEDNPWWYKSEYELWDMACLFEGLDYQPYLKMLNQTTGIWHVEACSPACRTLTEALKERFGGREMRIAQIA